MNKQEPIQLNIQQIANGYLVSAPDYDVPVTAMMQQRPAKTQHCEDYNAVITYLKRYFPSTIVQQLFSNEK